MPRSPICLAVAGSLALLGCRHGYSYYVSTVSPPLPAGVTLDEKSSEATIQLPELQVKLMALDDTSAKHPRPIPKFAIYLTLKPDVPGYSFNPMRVAARTGEGEWLPPARYVGPGVSVTCGDCDPMMTSCVLRNRFLGADPELSGRTESIDHPVLKKACFVLSFDTKVIPPNALALRIEGLARGGATTPLPDLHFRRQPGRSLWAFERPPAID